MKKIIIENQTGFFGTAEEIKTLVKCFNRTLRKNIYSRKVNFDGQKFRVNEEKLVGKINIFYRFCEEVKFNMLKNYIILFDGDYLNNWENGMWYDILNEHAITNLLLEDGIEF